MNLGELLNNGLGLVGAFTPQIAIFIFLVCFIGEAFVVCVPLLFETTWLAAGYQFSHGTLPLIDLLLLVLVAITGRQAGALVLYLLSRHSTSFLSKFISRRMPRAIPTGGIAAKLLGRVDTISAFWVAAGRLFWLRIPFTLLLGARRRLKTLMVGIVLSSVVYEIIYIGIGAIVGVVPVVKTGYVLLFFAGGLAVLYGITYGIRRLVRAIRHRGVPTAADGVG